MLAATWASGLLAVHASKANVVHVMCATMRAESSRSTHVRMLKATVVVKVPLITEEEKANTAWQGSSEATSPTRSEPPPLTATPTQFGSEQQRVSCDNYLRGVARAPPGATGRLMRRMVADVKMQEAQQRTTIIDGAPWIRCCRNRSPAKPILLCQRVEPFADLHCCQANPLPDLSGLELLLAQFENSGIQVVAASASFCLGS